MTDWTSYTSKKYVPRIKSKARQRADKEDRTLIYRDWRREFPKDSPATTDCDQIEWIKYNNEFYPCAVLELTRADYYDVGQKYLNAIIGRYFVRDNQERYATRIAELLKTTAWLILFNKNLSRFWIYNISHPRFTNLNGWWKLSPAQYMNWIKEQGEIKRRELEETT